METKKPKEYEIFSRNFKVYKMDNSNEKKFPQWYSQHEYEFDINYLKMW